MSTVETAHIAMSRIIRSAVVAAMCAASTMACTSPDVLGSGTSGVIGSWRLVEAPDANTPACAQAGHITTFFPNGAFEVRHAEMALTGTYTSRPLRLGREHMTIAYTGSNGRPNCQGFSADYVIRTSKPEFEVERRGDDLYICPIGESGCIIRMTRERK